MARDDDATAAGTIIVAFLLGAVTGAAIAFLVAPTSGEDMRRKIADRAREGRDRATSAARQGREFIDRQRQTVSSAIERGKEAYHQARGSTTPSASATPETPGGDNL
jgi:gas vesicle protein